MKSQPYWSGDVVSVTNMTDEFITDVQMEDSSKSQPDNSLSDADTSLIEPQQIRTGYDNHMQQHVENPSEATGVVPSEVDEGAGASSVSEETLHSNHDDISFLHDEFMMSEDVSPTPLICEDVASAMACSTDEINEAHPSNLHPQHHVDTRMDDTTDLSDVANVYSGDQLVSANDYHLLNTVSEVSSADDAVQMGGITSSELLGDDLPVVGSGLVVHSIPSLDELLQSIDNSQLPESRSLYQLANVSLSLSDMDSLLASVNIALPPSQFALHYAVLQRDLGAVYLLMRSRYSHITANLFPAVVNDRDSMGRTPLHIALLSADYTVLQLLLSMPLSPHPMDEATEWPEFVEMDFPDISLQFSQLPSFHLPLARAGWAEYVPDVLATYSLLLAYSEVTQKARGRGDMSCPGLDLLATTCGWIAGEASSSSHEGPMPLHGSALALTHLAEFLESREEINEGNWSVDARDEWNATALHRASELGVAEVVEKLLDAGADPLLKDCNGDLPVHRAVDSSDPDTFAVLLRRGGAAALVDVDHVVGRGGMGCDPWSEDTSMMALFKRCILRGSWRCLGRLVTDEVYSQFPIPEAAVDGLLDFASLCGYSEEFSEAFKMAVDNAELQEDGAWRRVRAEKPEICELKIFTHDACFSHLPLPSDLDRAGLKRFKLLYRFPENPSRLHCLTPAKSGILRTRTFSRISWEEDSPAASLADILRVHDWSYIKALAQRIEKVTTDAQLFKNTKPFFFDEVDTDTPVTPGSWEAAKRAAGVVIAAVKSVCRGETRQAFCAVRPPGHHVGTWGACQPPTDGSSWQNEGEEDWAHGSQGFCLLNNIAIGAAYARYNFAAAGIHRIAIVDFDVHHGNGTEQIVLNVKPRERKLSFGAHHHFDLTMKVEFLSDFWKVWLDESDSDNVFFVSIHGFGNRFYPGTGSLSERESHPNLHNVTVENGVSPGKFKELFRSRVIDPLAAFRPDLILVSAGFDAHSHDLVNEGFGTCSEFDYFWMTRHLVAVANDCCDGRIVSVLEGGYNTKAGTLSPLAQSAAYHVKGFLQTPPGLGVCAARVLDGIVSGSVSSLTKSDHPVDSAVYPHVVSDSYSPDSTEPSIDDSDRVGVKRRGLSERSNSFTSELVEAAPKRRRRAAAIKALAHIEERQTKQKLTRPDDNTTEKTEAKNLAD